MDGVQRPAVAFAEVAQSLFDFSGLPLAALDHDLRIGAVNDPFLQHFGGTAEQRAGQHFLELIHPAGKDLLGRQFGKLGTGPRRRFTERLVGLGPGDRVFSGSLTCVSTPAPDGRVAALAVHIVPDGILRDAAPGSSGRMLSDLDARILEGLAGGASTIQLADRLHLSRQGIEYRVAALLRRLQVPNRTALVSRAYAVGILGIGTWPPKVLPEVVE
jgi:DNA-binding CsgD family transcriptional regulator